MIKEYLLRLLNGVEGCLAILVYDITKESSPIFRVGDLSDAEVTAIKQNVGVFNSSIERVEKLCKANASKTIMGFYNRHQIYIFSKGTIVFIIVANSETNTGMILNLRNYLEPLVSEFQSNTLNEVASTASFTLPNSASTSQFNNNNSSMSGFQNINKK